MTAADNLVFTPECRTRTGSNELQIANTQYRGVNIAERTFIPWNIFRKTVVQYVVDLQLPMDTEVKGGEMSQYYYTSEGYGLPVFDQLEDAVEFIDKFKS